MSNLYLVTMGPSPYSEKARWALDLLGRSYTEERCIPGLHRPALKRIQAGLTCPALVVNKKELFTDSSDILRWVDGQLPGHQKLFPEDPIQGSVVKDFCQHAATVGSRGHHRLCADLSTREHNLWRAKGPPRSN
ncbi:MAG: glutathione S-transferase N-terminal domain-containing protein [Candidatus Eremiobacteraeota bacterium]|nr:glutathione S-transferase N-terminal domain-containing protein [Candidatus Eremiobacteraeota bacterium]